MDARPPRSDARIASQAALVVAVGQDVVAVMTKR